MLEFWCLGHISYDVNGNLGPELDGFMDLLGDIDEMNYDDYW
jgi:hypothetical protein